MKKTALLSTWNKDKIELLATSLLKKGYVILATGGTANYLEQTGFPVTRLETVTGFEELLNGRVKTLHPKVFSGILTPSEESLTDQEKESVPLIEVVVCNLYPYWEYRDQGEEEIATDFIDIGGSALIRAAAKNYKRVSVLVNPAEYEEFIVRLENDELDNDYRLELAAKAFQYVAWYDSVIASDFVFKSGVGQLERKTLAGVLDRELRYGENPHQRGWFYLNPGKKSFFKQLHGKPVSYNNLLDFTQGLRLVLQFDKPSCAIMKHTNPCGFAVADDIETAFDWAFETDRLSAYGSIMVFSRPITLSLAEKLHNMFVDGILAPKFEPDAFELLAKKKKLMLCELEFPFELPDYEISTVPNGFIVQEADKKELSLEDVEVVSEKKPSYDEMQDLMFAWKICKVVKSNAAVIVKGTRTLGIAGGATSRIDAVRQACLKAGERAKGAVLASDAFFPFRDSVDFAAQHGITAIMAPKGSIRDPESIQAANENNVALIFSKIRGFKH